MQPIATNGVVWSVCLPVCHDPEPYKNCWTDRDAVLDVHVGGCREPYIRWRSRSPHVKRQFWGRKGSDPGHVRTCLTVDILKATQQGAEPVQCRCRLGCTKWDAHWRHQVNTIELSVCSGYVKLLCWPLVILVVTVLTVVGLGWRYSCHCWEDDVWPATAWTWTSNIWWPTQEWRAQKVYTKKDPNIFSYSMSKHWLILIIFGRNVT